MGIDQGKREISLTLHSRRFLFNGILCLSICRTRGFAFKATARGACQTMNARRCAWHLAAAPPETTYTPDTLEKTKILINVLEDHECEGFEALELGVDNTSGLRGVYAKLDFSPGEYICAVLFPSTLLLEDNLESSMAGPVFESIEDTNIRQGLRFLQDFCHDETSSKQWQPYLDTLPTTNDEQFDATPDFWGDSVIRQLQIPRLMEESLRRKREIARVANEVGVSMEELQWATWVGRTRGFSTFKVLRNDEGDEATLQQRAVLLPYLDMLNHNGVSPNASIEVVETPGSYEDSFYALQALTPISAGDEITICYGTGRETCLDLLSTYGFWLSDDPADEFMLDWSAVGPQWTTTLEEDQADLKETSDPTLEKVLSLRIHLKQLQERIEKS